MKQELTNQINATQTDFIAHFNSGSDHYVNVELLCTPEETFELTGSMTSENPLVGSTFIVYESGHVMISCKIKSRMKHAYDRFIKLIDDLYPSIYDEFSTNKKLKKASAASSVATSAASTPVIIQSPLLLPGTIIKRKPKVQVVPDNN